MKNNVEKMAEEAAEIMRREILPEISEEAIPDHDEAWDRMVAIIDERWVSDWNFPSGPKENPEFFRHLRFHLIESTMLFDLIDGWMELEGVPTSLRG